MRRAQIDLALLLSLVLVAACQAGPQEDDDDTVDDDDTSDDDDSSGQGDDDDFDWEDPPVFLASYDFSLVLLENQVSGTFATVHGQMDISVSTTAFLAEMVTETGETWDWGGSLDSNAQQFLVNGWMTPPGSLDSIWIEVAGNFLGDADGTPSESCMAGIGTDDDPNDPDIGLSFAWYGCQQQAPPAAIDRSGSHAVTVTVHGDNCSAWTSGTWTESWQMQGRRLIVTRDSHVGYGILSDDGNKFHFTMLESETPGRSLKVVGDFTNPNGTTEARATGYCAKNQTKQVGAVMDMAY